MLGYMHTESFVTSKVVQMYVVVYYIQIENDVMTVNFIWKKFSVSVTPSYP